MMETMPKPFVAITYYALYILGVLILVPAIVCLCCRLDF